MAATLQLRLVTRALVPALPLPDSDRKPGAPGGAAGPRACATFGWLLMTLAVSAYGQERLTLRQALDAAAKLNPEVQVARLRILESEAQAAVVRSGYLLQAQAAVSGAYQTTNLQGLGLIFPGFPSRVGPYRTFDARPQVTQTVIDLSLLQSIRSARELARAARFDAASAREATLFTVLQLYLQALEAESRIGAAEARLRTAEAVLNQTRELERGGKGSRLDVRRVEQQYESERLLGIAARRDRDVLKTLARTIGMDSANFELEPPETGSRKGEASEAEALAGRPELKALEVRQRAATLDVAAAERQRWPRLSAVGNYGLLGAGPDRSLSTYQVGGALTVPLWTGRRIESEIDAARARSALAGQELRNTQLQVRQEVRQAAIELAAAGASLDAATKSAAAARESLELARLRFSSGIVDNVDTVVAQSTLTQAEDVEIRARYDVQLAKARMARAKGDVYSFLD